MVKQMEQQVLEDYLDNCFILDKTPDLSNKHIGNLSFKGRHIDYWDFSGSILTGANFSKCVIKGVNFTDCRLDDSNFYKAFLEQVRLINCDLNRSVLARAVLDSCCLNLTEFSGRQILEASYICCKGMEQTQHFCTEL